MAKTKCICPFCKSDKTIKKGFRKTENRGLIQRYFCKNCNMRFVLDEGFYRMRNNPKKITKAIDLYFSNLSSRKVRNNFRRHEETKVSHISVLAWCRKYSKMVGSFVDTLKPSLSGRSYADDTEVKVKGFDTHLWVSIDWETRFINGMHYSQQSGLKEAITFLKNITKNELPKYIQTDSAMFYPRAFRNTFGLKGRGKNKVEHRTTNARRTGVHNVRIETVFMKLKDRIEDFRGLKCMKSAELLLNGLLLQHNFIEEHTTTGQLPCELARLKLEVGFNRWLGLIRLSSHN